MFGKKWWKEKRKPELCQQLCRMSPVEYQMPAEAEKIRKDTEMICRRLMENNMPDKFSDRSCLDRYIESRYELIRNDIRKQQVHHRDCIKSIEMLLAAEVTERERLRNQALAELEVCERDIHGNYKTRNKKGGKTMKKIMTLMAPIVLMGCLTGCTFDSIDKIDDLKLVEKVNAVILTGKHANAALPNTSKMEDEIMKVCKSYGTVSVIAVDGEPYLVGTVDVPEQTSKLSDTKKEQIAKQQTAQIMGLLEQGTAKSDDVDVLEALQMAARALQNCEGEKKLLILDTGLSTKGLVDFSTLLLENDRSGEIVEALEKENAIMDLSNVSVFWGGLGNTIEPQEDLYEKNRRNLQNTWQAILEKAEAEEIYFQSDLSRKEEIAEGLPEVKTVPILKPASLLKKETFEIEEIEENDLSFKFDEETIAFEPGTARVRTSRKKVLKVMEKMISYMKEHKDYQILLVGTTASAGTKEELKQLSLERCEAVKKIMVESGIRADQIKVLGLGYGNQYTIKDTDENGNFIESAGKENRNVILMSLHSDAAKKLLE